MSYYAVLGATSVLLSQQRYNMRRCRRRFNGPHRYVLFDSHGATVHFDEHAKSRRTGYTLQELLEWLAAHPDVGIAEEARELTQQLDFALHMKSAI